MNKEFSDKSIVLALQGDKPVSRNGALSWLYRQCYTLVEQYILGNSGSEDDAADIFQDAIVIFYQKVRSNQFQGESSIGTYLYAVARNLWLKKLRKARFDLSKLEVDESYTFDEEAIIQSSQLTMRKALEQIGDTCKNLLIDFYFNKKSMMTLTEVYGLGSSEATKNKKYRCIQKLITFVKKSKLKRTDFVNE